VTVVRWSSAWDTPVGNLKRIDLRHLDAKPEGIQLYSRLLLEEFSRTIPAGSLTPEQEVGIVLQAYFQALLRWGLWEEVLSDHGGQFQSHAFARANWRLGIRWGW